jgi:nicotinamide-nucleotide amidase
MPAPITPAAVQALLLEAGATVATAESLTGGLLGASFTSVPGSSAVYLGGVVSYATALKVSLLGVSAAVIDRSGVVSAECAEAMAAGVRELTGSTYALSTTGVAGPDEQEGRAAGTVYVGLAGPNLVRSESLVLAGDRELIRERTVAAALSALSEQLSSDRRMSVGEETPLG